MPQRERQGLSMTHTTPTPLAHPKVAPSGRPLTEEYATLELPIIPCLCGTLRFVFAFVSSLRRLRFPIMSMLVMILYIYSPYR